MLSEPGRTLIVMGATDEPAAAGLAGVGADVERMPAEDDSIDLAEVMRWLGSARDITSVLVEGGGIV